MVFHCVSFLCVVATFLNEGVALVSIKSVDKFLSVTLLLLGRSISRLAVLNMFYNLVSVTDSGHAGYNVEMARFRRTVGSCETVKHIEIIRRIRRL